MIDCEGLETWLAWNEVAGGDLAGLETGLAWNELAGWNLAGLETGLAWNELAGGDWAGGDFDNEGKSTSDDRSLTVSLVCLGKRETKWSGYQFPDGCKRKQLDHIRVTVWRDIRALGGKTAFRSETQGSRMPLTWGYTDFNDLEMTDAKACTGWWKGIICNTVPESHIIALLH